MELKVSCMPASITPTELHPQPCRDALILMLWCFWFPILATLSVFQISFLLYTLDFSFAHRDILSHTLCNPWSARLVILSIQKSNLFKLQFLTCMQCIVSSPFTLSCPTAYSGRSLSSSHFVSLLLSCLFCTGAVATACPWLRCPCHD